MTFLFETPILPILFLLGELLLTSCSTALLTLGKFKSKEIFRTEGSPLFFFRPFLHHSSKTREWENFYFILSMSRQIYMLAYAISALYYLISALPNLEQAVYDIPHLHNWLPLILAAGAIIGVILVLDYVFRLISSVWSKLSLHLSAPFASLYLLFLFPIVSPLLFLSKELLRKLQLQEESAELLTDKSKLRDLIQESDLKQHLDLADQKLINSFFSFKERVAKEIMVPRVDLFALESDTSIQDAAKIFATEGYSRIPIYRDTLDHICGVILYKDLLKTYTMKEPNLLAPLQSIAKPVIYTPENKKISQLLQEFRTKQIHLAIIVDEYGGTEGIVTIEDILEELVGEIEDEYDVGEDQDIAELPSGGWIVDAKISIIDLEGQIGIQIPQNPEYETLGGYIFHLAGTIPAKGWRLSHDNFDLEVVSSDERSLKKIKIIPRKTTPLAE